ncbi:MAG: NAD(P)/FAD-dependent oxidoreductase [Gemmataceae bacterium]
MTLSATLNFAEASSTVWDVIVVGAGPAGSLAARQIARQGLKVLLVDKASFPRWKVCGCCLNARALTTLSGVGLGGLSTAQGAVPLQKILLAAPGGTARVRLKGGVALSRESLDAALIASAIEEGACFLPETFAKLDGIADRFAFLRLTRQSQQASCSARVLIAADGLGGRLLAGEPGFFAAPSPNSWIGAGAIADASPDFYRRGAIYMATGKGGYVGLVRLEDERLDVAAAFDPVRVRNAHGPHCAVEELLQAVGWPLIPSLAECVWKGTPPLTRRAPRVAGQRIFMLGDASGYVEPFTGEGIAWALSSAVALVPLATEAARSWHPSFAVRWTAMHRKLIRNRQRPCRAVTWVLRHPDFFRRCVAILSRWPGLATPLVRHLNAPVRI